MNKCGLLCALLCGAIGIGRSVAQQDAAPAPPSPPFVQELPVNAAWKITFVQKNKPSEVAAPSSASPAKPGALHAAVSLKEEKLTRMDDSMRVVKQWSDGSTSEEWRYQGFTIFTQPYTTEIYVLGRSKDSGLIFPTMADSAFPELDWLSATNYVRVENIRQKSAYLFQEEDTATASTLAPGKNLGLPQKSVHLARRAWIDRATNLPVAFDDGIIVHTYEYAEAPTTPLSPPAAFAEALERMKRSAAGLHKEKLKL